MTPDRYDDVKALLRRRAESRGRRAARLREDAVVLALPLAENVARRFSGRGEPYDDLLQVARLGLIQAVDRFDPRAGSDFLSFAVPTVMGEVRRHFRDRAPVLRAPRGSRELRDKVFSVREELAQELRSVPTDDDVAARLGVTAAQVRKALDDCSSTAAVSLDRRLGPEEDGQRLVDRLLTTERGYDRVDDSVRLADAVAGLAPRERRILGLRFFALKSQSEIADEVGISQMHVSRLLRRSLDELRSRLQPTPAAA